MRTADNTMIKDGVAYIYVPKIVNGSLLSIGDTCAKTTLKADELTNVSVVTHENVPIPEGFYHVAGTTKDTGIIISSEDGDDLNNTKKETNLYGYQ